jgi:hypothetical protein
LIHHVADLSLGLGYQDFKIHFGNGVAVFMLQKDVSDLQSVTICDNNTIGLIKLGDLTYGDGQIVELLLGRALLSFTVKSLAAYRCTRVKHQRYHFNIQDFGIPGLREGNC